MHAVTLTLSDGNDIAAESQKPALNVGITREEAPFGWEEWTMIRTQKDLFVLAVGDKQPMNFFLRDRYVNGKDMTLRDDDVTVTDYDESVISFKSGRMCANGVGETTVTVRYKDLAHVFRVVVVATDEEKNARLAETKVELPISEFTIYLGERSIYRPQIRVRITKGDGSVQELYVNDGENVLTFTGFDENIIAVSDKGVVTARAKGTTEVTVKYGSHTMKAKIRVSNDPADAFFGMEDIEEMNLVALDFTKELDRTALSHFNCCEMTAIEGGMRITVTSKKTEAWATDPSFKIVYQGALNPVMTENYQAVEIVYRVPLENSTNTTKMEIFIGAGSVMDAHGGYSTQADLICDGEFHTLRIPVSHLDYWKDQLNVIRFDFFTAALSGDYMDIASIRLVA